MKIADGVAYGMIIYLWAFAAVYLGRTIKQTSQKDLIKSIFYLATTAGLVIVAKLHWHNTVLWLTTIWGLEFLLGIFPKALRIPYCFALINVCGWSLSWIIARMRDVDISAYFFLTGTVCGLSIGYLSFMLVLRKISEKNETF
jgi:hypothetical protein